MSNEEKKAASAIEAIHEIKSMLKIMSDRLDIMDNNIKLLNNKFIKSDDFKYAGFAKAPSATSTSQNLIKVFGRTKNQRGKPINNVHITIYSPEGNVLKTRKTDVKGYWESRLPAGEYVIELQAKHVNKKFAPININIKIDDTMHEYEVVK